MTRQVGRPKKQLNHAWFRAGHLRRTHSSEQEQSIPSKLTDSFSRLPSSVSPNSKWDLYGQTLFSPRSQMRRKSIGEQELMSVSNRLFDSSTQKKTYCYDSDVEDSGNHLLPFKQLKDALESNVICRNCFIWCTGKELDKKLVHITENTIGIATNLTCTCQSCGSKIFSINQPKTALENMESSQYCKNLNLPHGKALTSSKFHCIESKLAPKF